MSPHLIFWWFLILLLLFFLFLVPSLRLPGSPASLPPRLPLLSWVCSPASLRSLEGYRLWGAESIRPAAAAALTAYCSSSSCGCCCWWLSYVVDNKTVCQRRFTAGCNGGNNGARLALILPSNSSASLTYYANLTDNNTEDLFCLHQRAARHWLCTPRDLSNNFYALKNK